MTRSQGSKEGCILQTDSRQLRQDGVCCKKQETAALPSSRSRLCSYPRAAGLAEGLVGLRKESQDSSARWAKGVC